MQDGSGFARAVQPVSATTIHTGDEGLAVADVKIPVGGVGMPAYCAMPEKGVDLPVIVVLHEIFGVHEHIRDVCRRLAKLGYLAIAPELFWRSGDVSQMSDTQQIMTNVVAKTADAQVIRDIDATLDFAASTAQADLTRAGVTGFCWGGRLAWLYASESDRIRTAVAWYGRMVGAADDLHPRNPVDVVATLRHPVLGLYGGEDRSIPLDTIDKMRAACSTLGKNVEIVVYPDAGHAFFADYRPSYNKPAAEDAWRRMTNWFKQYLR
ncbi:MAG TPA: dienelactone hydrolase family protein [Candidatus Limnocylindrales bacterium]|nr:dienelactone hydrolase family protein [Candidatus Limnocylindrales bacterium]